jgi:hypothetical protein
MIASENLAAPLGSAPSYLTNIRLIRKNFGGTNRSFSVNSLGDDETTHNIDTLKSML